MTCVFTSLLDPIRNRPGDPYVRDEGAMTYGQACRLIAQDSKGEAVDDAELNEAYILVADARRHGTIPT